MKTTDEIREILVSMIDIIDELKSKRERIDRMYRENSKLTEALEFYANGKHFSEDYNSDGDLWVYVEDDGSVAKKALAKE